MQASDLEQYEYQLSQVKLALAKEPNNVEYLNLKDELQSLIDLTKEYLSTQQSAAAGTTSSSSGTSATSTAATTTGGGTARQGAGAEQGKRRLNGTGGNSTTPTLSSSSTVTKFKTGDECLAKYSGDGKFYPARITSIGGSDDTNLVYSVIFHGYSTTELVGQSDVKPLVDAKKRERDLLQAKEDEDKERKRKKYEKKATTKAEKTAEQGAKQKTWQSFAKKGTKKGVVIPGVQGASMFRSPEDGKVSAKVGVVGSGRGMTTSTERKRQTFLGGPE